MRDALAEDDADEAEGPLEGAEAEPTPPPLELDAGVETADEDAVAAANEEDEEEEEDEEDATPPPLASLS